jgi:hypothetical protein
VIAVGALRAAPQYGPGLPRPDVPMIVVLLTVVVIAAGAAYRLMALRAAPRPARGAAPPPKAGGRFSGVEIRTRGGACRAAQALRGRRFLSKDAPSLPLPDCTHATCACSFSKLPDRRTEGRRLDYGTLNASLFLTTNRRMKRDRRGAALKQQRDQRRS